MIDDEVMKIVSLDYALETNRVAGYRLGSLARSGDSEEITKIMTEILAAQRAPDESVPMEPSIVAFKDRLIVTASLADHRRISEILQLLETTSSDAGKNADSITGIPLGKVISLGQVEADSAARVIEAMIQADRLFAKTHVKVDHLTNSVVVTGTKETIRAIEAVLRELDERPPTLNKSGSQE